MAKDYKREDILYPDQKIIQSELVHEMQTSYIERSEEHTSELQSQR